MTPAEIFAVTADRLQVNPPVPTEIAQPLEAMMRALAAAEQMGQFTIGTMSLRNGALVLANAIVRFGQSDQDQATELAPHADSEERCGLTELLRRECSHCRGDDEGTVQPPAKVAGRWRVFTASYPGRCHVCGESFDAGDDIARRPDGNGYNGPCHLDET